MTNHDTLILDATEEELTIPSILVMLNKIRQSLGHDEVMGDAAMAVDFAIKELSELRQVALETMLEMESEDESTPITHLPPTGKLC